MGIRISSQDVEKILESLIKNEITRDDAEQWAYERMLANDNKSLIYIDERDEKRIWDAVMYLLGAGLKNDPNTYFHPHEDFLIYLQTWKQRK
jgi:hypothetical protein